MFLLHEGRGKESEVKCRVGTERTAGSWRRVILTLNINDLI